MTGVLHTARISTVKVIMSGDNRVPSIAPCYWGNVKYHSLLTVWQNKCIGKKCWFLIFLQYNCGLLLVYVTPGRAWRTKPLQHSVFKWQLGTSSTFKFLQTPLNFFIKIYKQMMAVSCSFVTKNEMKWYYVIIVLAINECDWQLDSVITTCGNLVKGLLIDLTDENVWHLYKKGLKVLQQMPKSNNLSSKTAGLRKQ